MPTMLVKQNDVKEQLEAAYLAYSYGRLTWDELVREVRGINGGNA